MKALFACLLACLPAVTFAQQGHFTIEGSLGNYNTPAKIYLQHQVKGKDVIDSATMTNGKFKFAGLADAEPVKAVLSFNANGDGFDNRDVKPVFLENGTITIAGAVELKKAVAGGTPANIDNEQLNDRMAVVNTAMENLSAKVNAASDQEKQSQEFQKNVYEKVKDIGLQYGAVKRKFISEHPDSYISIFTLNNYAYAADYKDIEPLWKGLSARIKQTGPGRDLAARLPQIKAIALGATAPDFAEADTSGKMISLSSFRGKYVLLDFWASWRGPCRAENPNILSAFNLYKEKNFTVFGISLDGPDEKKNWVAAIRKDGLPWAQVSDLNSWYGKAATLYLIKGIPQNVLIDPNGKIIAKNLRSDDLQDKLKEVFGKL